MKTYIMLFAVAVIVGFTVGQDVYNEDDCKNAGGICAHGSTCLESPYVKGLCPKQRSKGVECCADPAIAECKNVGGECIENCPEKIWRKDLICPAGLSCCIWLR